MKQYLIYIAGPYTAETPWKIEQNCRRAEEVSLQVWKAGHLPVCPHLLGRHFFGEIQEDVVINGLLELMIRCDGVMFIGGYQSSPGCMRELEVAREFDIPRSTWATDSLKFLVEVLDSREPMVTLKKGGNHGNL